MATYYVGTMPCSGELYHYGVKGMKWGKHLFGLAENVGGYVRGAAQYAYGRATGNKQNQKAGQAAMNLAGRQVRRFGAGLRETASNTAYNARQFVTGSEDRNRRNKANQMMKQYEAAAKLHEKNGDIAAADRMRARAKQYENEYNKAQKEYESMTLPGMAEKTYRDVNATLKRFGLNAKDFYDKAKERVNSSMVKIAGDVGKAATWITTGFAAIMDTLKSGNIIDKLKSRKFNGTRAQSGASLNTATGNNAAPTYMNTRAQSGASLNTATGNMLEKIKPRPIGVSLYSPIDYDAVERRVNGAISRQNENFANVETVTQPHVSREYLEELEYNSRSNQYPENASKSANKRGHRKKDRNARRIHNIRNR